MKRFKFRLERVLQYRQVVKEEARRELLLKNSELQEELAQLQGLEQAAAAAAQQQERARSAAELHLLALYAARMRQEIEKQQKRVAKARAAAEEAQRIYVAAAKEAEALRLLKQKRRTEYLEVCEKEEQKFLDELNTQRSKRVSGPHL
jgi:flagellar protein FliJ